MPKNIDINRERIVEAVERIIPEFAKMCHGNIDLILLNQEEFAADYDVDECTLLGMAIKYAGMKGREVRILKPTTVI